MKKLALLWAAVVFGMVAVARADVAGTGPAPVPLILPTTPSPVYFHVGALNLVVPWDQVNVVYLFDVPSKTNLVGGEMVVATIWKLQGTFGAVTSIEGVGSPFIGGNLWFSNPIPQIALLGEIKPGIFGGYNFREKTPLFGFKASMPIFN